MNGNFRSRQRVRIINTTVILECMEIFTFGGEQFNFVYQRWKSVTGYQAMTDFQHSGTLTTAGFALLE